ATGTELPQAAAAVATSMNVFSLSGDQATRVANVFAAGANKAATDVGQLQAGLAQGGAVFAMYGMTVEESVGALALFSDYGIQGSDAATSMKAALTTMNSGVGASAKQMAKLGIEMYDANGEFVGMDGLASELQRTLGGLTEEERNLALTRLGGTDGMRALNILYQEGAAGVDEYTAAVTGTDAATAASAIRMDTLSGAMEELSGSVETLMIVFLSGLLPGIRVVVDAITGFTNFLINLPGPVQSVVVGLTALAGVVATLGGAFLLFGPQIASALGLLKTLKFAGMIGGLAPILGPLALIGAAVGALYLAYKTNFLGIGDAIDGFVQRFKDAWASLGGTSDVMTKVLTWGNQAGQIVGPINNVSRALSAMGAAIRGLGGGDIPFFNAIADGFQGAAGFVERFKKAWDDLSGNGSMFKNFFEQTGQGADTAAEKFSTWEKIVISLSDALRGIDGPMAGAATAIANTLDWARFIAPIAWDAFVEILAWTNFIGLILWEGFITLLDWAAFVAPYVWDVAVLAWDVFVTLLDWALFITPYVWDVAALAWDGFVKVVDWTLFIGALAWDGLVKVVDWTLFIGSLAWDGLVKVVDWTLFIGSLAWSGFVTVLDWATYIGSLAWDGFVTVIDWGIYVGSLAWEGFVVALDWGIFVASFLWSGFVTALNWASYVGSLAWSGFVTAVDLGVKVTALAWSGFVTAVDLTTKAAALVWSGFVTAVDLGIKVTSLLWSGFVTAVDLGVKVGSLAWSGFVTAVDLGIKVAALAWSGFVTAVDLGLKVGALAWSGFVTAIDLSLKVGALVWSGFVTAVDLGAKVVALAWSGFVTAVDLGAEVVALAWSGFVTAVDLTTSVVALAWSGFVTAVDLTTNVVALAWSTFVTALGAWSDFVPDVSWSSFIPSLEWPSKSEILSALTGGLVGGTSDAEILAELGPREGGGKGNGNDLEARRPTFQSAGGIGSSFVMPNFAPILAGIQNLESAMSSAIPIAGQFKTALAGISSGGISR
ncbi:MAG: phage tail tape measure protein, partial [Chloroflexota bacterium]|nr:phage tail tape measure protein [Chloroflexota bacterium]